MCHSLATIIDEKNKAFDNFVTNAPDTKKAWTLLETMTQKKDETLREAIQIEVFSKTKSLAPKHFAILSEIFEEVQALHKQITQMQE